MYSKEVSEMKYWIAGIVFFLSSIWLFYNIGHEEGKKEGFGNGVAIEWHHWAAVGGGSGTFKTGKLEHRGVHK